MLVLLQRISTALDKPDVSKQPTQHGQYCFLTPADSCGELMMCTAVLYGNPLSSQCYADRVLTIGNKADV
jgi:hypothetical protein